MTTIRAFALGLFLAAVAVWLPFGHLYLLNTTNLTLPFAVHLARLALLGGLVVLVATALQLETPRRMRPTVRAGLLAVGIFLWAQTTLFVGDFGFFTGAAPDWGAHRHLLFLEIGLAVLLVTIVARRRDLLLRRAGLVMLVLALSAAANLVGPWRAEQARTKQDVQHTFTRTGVFDVSTDRNVLVFILDTYQTDVFADIVADDPSWRAVFDGFTYFPDAVSGYPKTYASIPELLSGRSFDNTEPFPDYMRDAYLEASAPRLLKKNGFDVRYHSIVWAPYLAHPDVADNLAGFDSADEIRWMRDRETALLSGLLAFRLAPFALKPRVHGSLGFGRRSERSAKEGDPLALPDSLRVHSADNDHEDFAFLDELLAFMKPASAGPAARVYHLGGPHAPFQVDADLNYTGPREYAPGPYRDQAVASLRLMQVVFDRLREVGAYDNSLIVIVGDHGNGELPSLDIATDAWARLDGGPEARATDDPDLLEVIRGGLPLVLAKPPGANGPLRVSPAPVELADVAATVARVMDLEGAEAVPGRSLFDEDPDPGRRRLHRHYRFAGWGQDYIVPMTEWVVAGFSWDPRSWSRTDRNLNRNAVASVEGDMVLLGLEGNLDDFAHAGWSAPAPEGRSIVAAAASVVMPVPADAGSAALHVVLRQVGPEIPPRFRILVDGETIAVAEAGGDAPVRRRVYLPDGILTPGTPVELRFVSLTGSLEGTQFVEIRLDHRARRPVWPLGEEISFTRDGTGDRFLNHGWAFPDPEGTWSRGSTSSLALALDRRPLEDLAVRMFYSPAIFPGSPPVRVRVLAGGETVAEFEAVDKEWLVETFRIPGHLVPRNRNLDLEFQVENPRSASQFGVNSDTRLMGIWLQTLSFGDTASGD